jgi:antibiotic biosynthesis monooxygenase (ABM) superfamily enzyme
MKRRTYISTMMLAGAGLLAPAAGTVDKPIQLHVDLTVDPAKEQEMLNKFHTVFKPAASKQPGYIDVQMLKLRSTLNGQAPPGVNYRFVLTFKSEELRQAWITSATHQKVWPMIEGTLANKNYNVLLFDQA